MCDDLVVNASACAFRNKMICAVTLDYSEEKVCIVSLSLSLSLALSDLSVPRGMTQVKLSEVRSGCSGLP